MKKLFQLTIVSLAFLALATLSLAQQPESSKSPLVRLLQSKGIITEQEAAMVSSAATPAQAEQRLADLLLAKGVISRQEYDDTLLALGAGPTPSDESVPRLVPVVAHVGEPTTVKPAPAKTSASIVNRLNKEVVKVLNMDDIKQKFFAAGIEVVGSSPDQLAAKLKVEMVKMAKVVKDANIRVD